MRAHRARHAAERLELGEGWGGKRATFDLVFTSSIGTPLDPKKVNRQIQAIAREAGLGKWTPHDLRQSAASLLLARA